MHKIFNPLIDRLRIKRNKEIAHLDRIFVNSSLRPDTHVEGQELFEFFQAVQEILTRYHTYYFGLPPKRHHLNADELAYFGPEGLEDILTLALKSLEDETIQDVSEHIRQVRVWRKSRLEVQAEKTKLTRQDS